MPLNHGNKFYCQLLIDPNRYKLAENLPSQDGKKVTAYLRELVYAGLALRSSEYESAKEADEAAWRESVKRRVEGRMRSRQEGSVLKGDA